MDRARWDLSDDSSVLIPLALVRSRLTAIVLALNLAMMIFAWIHLSFLRIKAADQATSYSQSVVSLVAANLEGIIGKIDIGLHAVVDEAETELASGGIDKARLDAFIVREQQRIPEIVTLRAANAEGQAIYGADLPVMTTSSIAQREYYHYLRDTKTDELVFSDPLVGGITGNWMVLVTRRIDRPDGSFAGLGAAGVGLFWLTKAFASFDVGAHGSVELRDQDLALVDGYPFLPAPSAKADKSASDKALASLIAKGSTSGHFVISGGGGGDDSKIVSFKKLGPYPLYVMVGLARRDYLGPWYVSVFEASAAILILLALSALLALFYYRRAQRSRIAARALASQELKYRTIADYTYDWEFWIDADGSYTYVSPSCERITGYRPSEFYRDSDFFASLIVAEDRDLYRNHRHPSKPDTEFATLSFRVRREDGETRWIEHLCRPVFSEAGVWMGTRGTNRDITERREAEERIGSLLEEKELILKEVHHRVKNNMTIVSSLLDMQSSEAADDTASRILQTAANRVRIMAVLYDRLYRSAEGIETSLAEYLSTLVKEIHGTFPRSENIALELDFEDMPLESGKLSKLGIILNELLTNSMKYAFVGRRGGRIAVRASQKQSRLRIEYEDDGIGLEGQRRDGQEGFGLTLIGTLAKQLDGRVEMSGEGGFRFSIEFGI